MKKILILLFVLMSVASFGQGWGVQGGVFSAQLGNYVLKADSMTTAEKIEAVETYTGLGKYGYVSEFSAINTTFNDSIGGETVMFGLKDAKTNVTPLDGTPKYFGVENLVSDTIVGFEFYLRVQGNFTANNTNSMSIYSIDVEGDTGTKEAETADISSVYMGATGWKRVYFTTSVYLESGVYYCSILYNNSAQTTAPGFLGMNIADNQDLYERDTYAFKGVDLNIYLSGQSTAPASFTISTATKSSSLPYVRLLRK